MMHHVFGIKKISSDIFFVFVLIIIERIKDDNKFTVKK